MIYLIIYIVGVIIASFVIPKMLPYEDDMWRIESYGVHKITKNEHFCDNIARILIWPLIVAILTVLLPIAVVSNLIEKLFEKIE